MKWSKKTISTLSDKELLPLLSGSRKEAEAAFTEFYNRYASKVHAFCLGMINDRDQAEDIFQDVFVRFYKNIRPEKEHKNIKSYLMTIARNLCINHLRSKKVTVPVEDTGLLKTEAISYENTELFEILVKSLELLSEINKEAFILREFDGYSFNEIAEMTNTSLSNAKSRVQRARQHLLEIMKPYLKEEIK